VAREALSEEIKKYGYVFSVKKNVLLYIFTAIVSMVMGRLFALNLANMIILMLFVIALLPFFIRNGMKNRYNQKRFSDVNTYMEQFLYSFEKNGKILETLRDVKQLFAEGTMQKKIEMAIHHIENTFDDDVEKDALGIIEREYGFDGMHRMHEFSLSVENEGGEYRGSAAILLDERRLWADRTYEYLKEKRHQRNKVFMSIASTLVLCSVIYIMADRMDLNTGSSMIVQIVTMIVLGMDMLIFYAADRRLSQDDFIKKTSDGSYEAGLEEKYFMKKEEAGTDRHKKFIKSLKGPFSIIHEKTVRKIVTRQIEKDFPKWLISMALLLQNDTVQVAIEKSIDSAPVILKPHLKRLVDELRLEPTGIKPFMNFLSEYTLPEVRASMKVLYSLSENGNGATSAEIEEILKRNEKLVDRAGQLKNQDRMAGMTALFMAPQITGGFKLIVDLGVMFTMYIAKMGV
jgi:Ca2+/Na+ antiporter